MTSIILRGIRSEFNEYRDDLFFPQKPTNNKK